MGGTAAELLDPARIQRGDIGSRCFSLFFQRFAADNHSFAAEILGCRRSGGRDNSEMARCFCCFPLFFSGKCKISIIRPFPKALLGTVFSANAEIPQAIGFVDSINIVLARPTPIVHGLQPLSSAGSPAGGRRACVTCSKA
jgi:hypothetical protein